MSVLELEDAIQLDILGRLAVWPHLTSRGVLAVCKYWHSLVASAPELAKSVRVREAPVAAGMRENVESYDVVPQWALVRFHTFVIFMAILVLLLALLLAKGAESSLN